MITATYTYHSGNLFADGSDYDAERVQVFEGGLIAQAANQDAFELTISRLEDEGPASGVEVAGVPEIDGVPDFDAEERIRQTIEVWADRALTA